MHIVSKHASIARIVAAGCLVAAACAFAGPVAAQGNRCDSCGTVVTTNRNDVKGGAAAGTVVGGVGGAVAGNALGRNTTSTVVGGVGGALAGNVIGRKLGTKKVWSVVVKMDRGGERSIDYADRDPGFHQGDRVRINDRGELRRI